MNASTASFAGSLVGWLADYYALATLLLLGALVAWRWIRQPAHRLMVAWVLSGELLVLAVVCALPCWPRFSLIAAAEPEAVVKLPAVAEPPPLVTLPMPVAPEAGPEQVSVDTVKTDAPEPPAVSVRRWPQLTGVQWIAVGYLAGAALVGLWLSWGAVATTWVRRRAWPAGPSLGAELSHVVPADGRRPRLLVSPRVVHAVALGVLRPTIVLPAALAESSSPPTLRAVLSHEWAHIRHRDLWLLALGRLLLLGLFAHPLFWWLRRAIRNDQELLADAVAAGENRQQYAEELLCAIRRAAGPTKMTVSAALGIWEGPSELSRRIAMLLDETFRVEPTGSRRWRVQALAWLVLAGAACSLVTLQPAPSTAEPAAAEAKPEPKAGQTDTTRAGNLTRVGGGTLVLSGSNESTSATSGDSWHPPEALVGTWLGKDRIHAPPEKGSPSQLYKDSVTIRIHIASDGSVEGQVGTARFVECKIKSNRGWLGRMLNLWSDYVICDGGLKGQVFRTDRNDAQRPFAIPFGLESGTLKGRFLLLREGEKPFSLFFHLELEKQPLTPAQATIAAEAKPEKKAGPTDAKPADGTKPAQKPVANETFMKRGSGTLYLDSATATSAKDDSLPYLPGYQLLMQRGVVKALDLSGEQKNKLRASASQYMAASREFFAQRKGLSQDARMKARAQWDAEQQKAIQAEVEAILTPRQSQVLQWFGLCEAAYGRLNELDPNLSKKLGLTKEQQLAVSSVRKEANDRIHRYLKENQDKMLAVLSPEQRTRLRTAALGPLRMIGYAGNAMKIPGRAEPIRIPSLFPYRDFSDASLRKALGLTADQQTRVRGLLENHDTLGQELAAQWQKLPPAEQEKWGRGQSGIYTYTFTTNGGRSSSSAEEKKRQAEFEEKLKKERQKSRAELESQPLVKKSIELRKQFEGLLTPKQLAQYQDMAVQDSQGSAISDPLMQREIGLSDEQKAAVQRLQMGNYEAIQQVSREMGERILKLLTPAQQEQLPAEISRQSGAPFAPPAKAKAESKASQTYSYGYMSSKYNGGFHLVRGTTMSVGGRTPVVYDDYDKNFWMSWGRHSVVLPTPPHRFGPGSIDLPAYEMLMQPSVQGKLNLTAEQKKRLWDISAEYWPARRKIAEKQMAGVQSQSKKELDELIKKSAKARALAEGTTIKLGGGGSAGGPGPKFSKEVLQELERQWQDGRRQIEEVLTPEQLQTLKEVTFRTFAFGNGIMLDSEVQERLGMDQKQREAVRQLDERLQKEKRERLRNVTRERSERLLAVLTPEQRTRLHKLMSPAVSPQRDYSGYPYPSLTNFAFAGDDSAAQELGLSAAQSKKACDAIKKVWEERVRLQKELTAIPYDDEKALKLNGEKTLQLVPQARKQLAAILTPAQLAAFEEMGFQNLTIPYLRVAKNTKEKLGLSDDQVKTLRQIDAEYVDRPAEIYGEMTDKMLAALTPAQQQMLRAEIDRRGW